MISRRGSYENSFEVHLKNMESDIYPPWEINGKFLSTYLDLFTENKQPPTHIDEFLKKMTTTM